MTFPVRQRSGPSGAALGAMLGDVHFHEICRGVMAEDELVFLDFTGVEATNGSYLKAVLLRLLLCGRLTVITEPSDFVSELRPLSLFPVVNNLGSAVWQELVEFAGARKLPVVVAGPGLETHFISTATIEGGLEPVLRQTLNRVLKMGETSAPQLHALYPDEGVAVTAWNNRLTELCALRLLRRRRQGRSWLYHAIAKEIQYGSSIH